MTPDEIANQVAEFVFNHEQHILDEVSDFGLLKPILDGLREALDGH